MKTKEEIESKKLYDADRYQRLKASDPQAVRVRNSDYYNAHKVRMLALNRAWAAANKEKLRKYNAEYHSANKDRAKALNAANPEKVRERCRTRRARKKNESIGNQKVMSEWDREWRRKRFSVCYWCCNRVPTKLCHTDHIIALSKGGSHSIENLVVSCAKCNLRKQAAPISEWNQQIKEPVLF